MSQIRTRRLEPTLSIPTPQQAAAPAPAAGESGARHEPSRRAKSQAGSGAAIFAILTLVALAVGWYRHDEHWLTPETGVGYYLGIAGSVFMLTLMLYPLRKRLRFMRHWGRVPNWLKSHMVLGILGPTLILFHANFELGATNSSVALIAMLIVVASGVVGRFFYSKTHNRFSGEVRNLRELRAATANAKQGLGLNFAETPAFREALDRLEKKVLDGGQGLASSTAVYSSLAFNRASNRRRLVELLKRAIKQTALAKGLDPRLEEAHTRAAVNDLTQYMDSLHRVAEFRFYERLFALWHLLHVPLLFILVFAAVIHVVAVHLY